MLSKVANLLSLDCIFAPNASSCLCYFGATLSVGAHCSYIVLIASSIKAILSYTTRDIELVRTLLNCIGIVIRTRMKSILSLVQLNFYMWSLNRLLAVLPPLSSFKMLSFPSFQKIHFICSYDACLALLSSLGLLGLRLPVPALCTLLQLSKS
jgi:hypothetical protein